MPPQSPGALRLAVARAARGVDAVRALWEHRPLDPGRSLSTSTATVRQTRRRTMKMGRWLLVAVGLTLAIGRAASAQTVEIEYWQYTFAQRVQAIDELIKRFEAENPTIKIKHTHVPY